MSKSKKSYLANAFLVLFLSACGQENHAPVDAPLLSAPLKMNSVFSATYLQSIQNTGSATVLEKEASLLSPPLLQTAAPQIESKSYDGKMEATNLLTSEKQIFDWPVTQNIDSEGNIETISHRALTLKPGRYDFVLVLTSKELGAQQYVAKALGKEIVHDENPEIDFVLSPNMGESINEFEQVKYLSTLKFSWPADSLAKLANPQFGLSINEGDEAIYAINKQTGLVEVTLHVVPGQYQLEVHLYDGDLMVGENEEEDNWVNLIEGEDLQIDIIPLQADISIDLDPLQNRGTFTFIVPKALVDEVGEEAELGLIVRMTDGNDVQEKMLSVFDENGVYVARDIFDVAVQKPLSAYLAFHRMRDEESLFSEPPIATCNTRIKINETQTLACNLELKRESLISARILGTLMLNVVDENHQSAIGAQVYLNGKLIGLTGEVYSTGSIKTHQVAGHYQIKAQTETHSAASEVQIIPLEILNEMLYLLPDSADETFPDFSFLDIKASKEPDSEMKLTFSWNGNPEGKTYTVCMAKESFPNNCKPMGRVEGKNQLDVALKSTYLLAENDFFIQVSKGLLFKSSNKKSVPPLLINSFIQYIKASNTNAGDDFGSAIALSADGMTLAVGASSEDSNAKGMNGDETNNEIESSGAVYVFKKSAEGWKKHAYIKASNPQKFASFGASLSLSADGNTLAVGARGESSNSQSVNDDKNNTLAHRSGAVYVYQQNANSWQQEAYIKASNAQSSDEFGASVSISADGNTLAVGAYGEDGTSSEGEVPVDDSQLDSGAAYVFKRDSGNWTQQAYLKASNADVGDALGTQLTLSADGNTLAVSSLSEQSKAVGINGDELDNSLLESGAVYVFTQKANTWTQEAYLKASNTNAMDYFGYSLSLSGEGDWLAVGAISESACDEGINADQTNNECMGSGAVYIFNRNGAWQQQAFLKAPHKDIRDAFGGAVSLNDDATYLAVGSLYESSKATALNGDALDNSKLSSGAVYLFKRQENDWKQSSYIKASNTGEVDTFSYRLALSADGETMAVSSNLEDSSATGVNGNGVDDSMEASGAVYIY